MLKFPIQCILLFQIPNWTQILNSELQMLWVMNCKKINKWISNQQCNRHLYFPGQHYSFPGFFQTFPYLWSFSRLFKALKISTLNSRTFHTFPGTVRTLYCSASHAASVTGSSTSICKCSAWSSEAWTTMDPPLMHYSCWNETFAGLYKRRSKSS